MKKQVKTIAFYLPQYHRIPENDKWWGEGFTEWTNVKKAKPLFNRHYQPRIPLEGNYYCLDDISVMIEQSKQAQKYGVYGFCYYHYWFGNGKKLLEKPIEKMLETPEVSIPFCMCWANENWSKNWDGGNREVIVEQDYGTKESWIKHIQYLIPYFKDQRYIRMNDHPIFLIYRPELISDFNAMIDCWNQYLTDQGMKKLIIIGQHPAIFMRNYKDYKLDYTIKFQPVCADMHLTDKTKFSRCLRIITSRTFKYKGLTIKNYDKTWQYILKNEPKGGTFIPGGFVDWDNTPRNKKGKMFLGATPQKFYKYFSELVRQVVDGKYSTDFIFLNAWNEWGEGCYLEPDEKFKDSYLKALRGAVQKYGNTRTDKAD